MGLTDRIFTRVASQEGAAVPQSAFLIELSQVAAMLRHATPRWTIPSRAGFYIIALLPPTTASRVHCILTLLHSSRIVRGSSEQ